jgi:hypothetical protein
MALSMAKWYFTIYHSSRSFVDYIMCVFGKKSVNEIFQKMLSEMKGSQQLYWSNAFSARQLLTERKGTKFSFLKLFFPFFGKKSFKTYFFFFI